MKYGISYGIKEAKKQSCKPLQLLQQHAMQHEQVDSGCLVCPVKAFAAVKSAEAMERIPCWLQSELGLAALTHVAPAVEDTPAHVREAASRLERWLCAAGGRELRKAKTLDAALRAAAPICRAWTSLGQDPSCKDDDALLEAMRRPRPEVHVARLALPEGFAKHVVGRRGRVLRPVLERFPGVRLQIDHTLITICGGAEADTDAVLKELQQVVATVRGNHPQLCV